MSRKQSTCPPSGMRHHLLDRRKHGRWSPLSRPCWLRSLTLTGWFIMSVSLEDRRKIRNSTTHSCNAFATLCADIALRSGNPAIGSCTMNIPLPTALLPQMNFWLNTTFCRSNTLPTPLTFLRTTSSCFQNWRKQWNVTDSITPKRFKPIRQNNWGLLQNETTRGAFVSGRSAGKSGYRYKNHYFKGDKTN